MLVKDLYYPITTNCFIRQNSLGRLVTMRGDEIEKLGEDYEIDNRLHCISFETTYDNPLETAIRYLSTIAQLSYIEFSKQGKQGQFVAMLDMGYMPVIMPPSFIAQKTYNLLMPLLKKTEIRYIELKGMRFDGSRHDTDANDVWGSRIDIAKYLGMPLQSANPLEFWRKALS